MDIQTESNDSEFYTSPELEKLSDAVEKIEFPEGGLSGWSTVAGALVSSELLRVSFSLTSRS
jgi:hypothetical protein